MNVDIINYLIDVLFRVSLFYISIKIVQEFRVLKYYTIDSEEGTQLDRALLALDVLLKIISYGCFLGIIIWVYFNIDIYIEVETIGELIDMV